MKGGNGQYGPLHMSGMFVVVKVRENLASYDEDPGWYQHPEGTVAYAADTKQLRRDGIHTA